MGKNENKCRTFCNLTISKHVELKWKAAIEQGGLVSTKIV